MLSSQQQLNSSKNNSDSDADTPSDFTERPEETHEGKRDQKRETIKNPMERELVFHEFKKSERLLVRPPSYPDTARKTVDYCQPTAVW